MSSSLKPFYKLTKISDYMCVLKCPFRKALLQSKPELLNTTQPPIALPMDPDKEIEFNFFPFLILYKSGRVERFVGTDITPACTDPATGVTSKDVIIDSDTGLAARLYLPTLVHGTSDKLPVMVYFHGGAFVVESAFSPTYQRYLNLLTAKAGVITVSVNYRLAPEHPLPAAYDDAWAALKWVITSARSGPETWLAERADLARLFLAGDSVGGNIAHNTAIRAGKEGLEDGARIHGIALLDPYFWGKDPVGTESTDAAFRQWVEERWRFVCAGAYTIDDPHVNPLTASDQWEEFLACDRVMVTVAELDILFRERGKAYAEALRTSAWAGEMQLYETYGEGHCYFLDNPDSEKAKKEMEFLLSLFRL